jgi:hypothetical protein
VQEYSTLVGFLEVKPLVSLLRPNLAMRC